MDNQPLSGPHRRHCRTLALHTAQHLLGWRHRGRHWHLRRRCSLHPMDSFPREKIKTHHTHIQKSPSANARTLADGDFRYIAPARCHIRSGSHKECSEGLPRGSFLLTGFLVFGFTFFLRFYLELLFVLRRVFFISALTRCISGPCGLRWKKSPCPKSCSSTRAAPRPWEQLLGSAPEETGNVC